MAEIRRYPHLFVNLSSYRIPFVAHGGGSEAPAPPSVRNRAQHSQRVTRSLESAIRDKIQVVEGFGLPADDAQIHVSVSARSEMGVITGDGFQNPNSALQLLSVKGSGKRQRANLLLSVSKSNQIKQRAQSYGEWDSEDRRPHNFFFFESIDRFYASRLEDLWLDDERLLPTAGEIAEWEIWVRPDASQRLRSSAKQFGIRFEVGEVEFSRVRILRAHARREDLQHLIDVSGAVMELRACSSLTLDVLDLDSSSQRALSNDLVSRVHPPSTDSARICILDTGVDHSHPLLSPALPQSRCFSLSSSWPENGWNPHGTRVAGIALYPDLINAHKHTAALVIGNALESVTVLRPNGGPRFSREAIGEIAAAVEIVESAEAANRVFCLAFTSPRGADDGVPSTLSGSVDQLAWGKDGAPRLFCVAAGNILDEPLMASGYSSRNEESGITCPGQASNALTVGGCTFFDEHPHDGTLLAGSGDISPTSRTSCSWPDKKAIKPDVVFEAGNHDVDEGSGVSSPLPELGVLTTNNHRSRKFATLDQTSAATAAVAGIAGRLMSLYPSYWPETIRGLIVHSTDWTQAMFDRVSDISKPDLKKEQLVSLFGYGVPNERRAMRSAADTLTLIAQSEFTPFSFSDGRTKATELAYHDLPWPKQILHDLGNTDVELRVTLSYFIEPDLTAAAAGRWSRYASHRLGFDIRGPDDDEVDVLRRQNGAAITDRPSKPPKRTEKGWALGSHLRERGTIHHDRFSGSARDIARQNGIRITPKKGWWTDESWKGLYTTVPIRYALIISLEAPGVTQDIYQATKTEMENMSRTKNKVLNDLAINRISIRRR